MATLRSTKKEQTGQEIRYEFNGVYDGASVFLNSNESVEILEILAHLHFLENGADKVVLDFSVPLCSVSVGDTVQINSPSYGVPLPNSKDMFVVTGVTHEFSKLSAITKISAMRYDF